MEIKLLLVFSLLSLSSCVSTTQYDIEEQNTKEYTCFDACNNYHRHQCHSQLDTCGFSCEDVCNFFTSTITTKPVLKCLSTQNSCKDIFRCVGY